MPVKRSLKLDVLLQENSPQACRSRGQLVASYSPTTGTREISPSSSPQTHGGWELGRCPWHDRMELGPSPGFPRRGQPRVENQDDIMMLLYKIDKSLEKFTETWQSLKHLKALMGRPELENLIGVSQTSLDLKSEVQKARELMIKVRKQEQPRQKTREHSTGDFGHLNSYEFLKSIMT
ncbi:centromere protein R isoform X3 [Monodelphis domestica]|uniref:Centromere protein R n=1 Tax=Monodelphis domestica TaxID=13616 RepID=A0A5F8G4M0_MONDO|nr:centromere protein R isoform X3 [Monodelphis domestica]